MIPQEQLGQVLPFAPHPNHSAEMARPLRIEFPGAVYHERFGVRI